MSNRNPRRRAKKSAASFFIVLLILVVLVFVVFVAIDVFQNNETTSSSLPSESETSSEPPASSETLSSETISSEAPVSSSASEVHTASQIVPAGKVCYLTFDDGPSQYTEQNLDILTRYNAHATYFVVGNAIKVYPSKLQKIINQGSVIALHTYTHEWLDVYSTDEGYFNDLYAVQDLVYQWTGIKTYLMRFPGGSSNTISRRYNKEPKIMSRLTKAVEEKGFTYFDWNADSNDATGNGVAVEKLIASVKNEAVSEKVCLLMHDTDTKGTTVEALPQILEYLQGQGYRFEVLSETSPTFHHGVNN